MSIKKITEKLTSWIKIVRIQFYPMTFVAYSVGAALSYTTSQIFNFSAYILGYIVLFFIELCTILSNEYYDYSSDRINKNASPFTGGSRMLVEGKIGFGELKAGFSISFFLILFFGYLLLRASDGVSTFSIVFLISAGIFLGLGYTVPPIKFSYRGWGEMVVGFTHSFYVILCGYVFQSGVWNNALPWLLSIPLFFAVSAAITLAGIPDWGADVTVSKKTIAVAFSPRWAAMLSIFFVTVAAISGVMLWFLQIIKGAFGVAIWAVVPHALILSIAVFKLIKTGNYDRKINPIMQLALSYIIWFGLIPLIFLIQS